MTTETTIPTTATLYRGQCGDLDLDSPPSLVWWAVALTDDDEADAIELAQHYTTYGHDGEATIYRARLSADAVAGEHEDFKNPQADYGAGPDWLIELMDAEGADYFAHQEGRCLTMAMRPDRAAAITKALEVLTSDDPFDGWEAV